MWINNGSSLPLDSQQLDLWTDLAQVFESFLFTTSKPPNNQSLEDQQLDESLDVKIIELVRNNVLPFASQLPKEFVLQMVALLNRGSIHSSSTGSPTGKMRIFQEVFFNIIFL